MAIPVELRAILMGVVALIIYLAASGVDRLFALILAGLFMAMYVALLSLDQRVRR